MNTPMFALFPGQGSQREGMGKELYDASPIAKELFARADAALGFSLSELCFSGSEEELTKTHIAQPAILTVSVIAFQVAQAKAPFTPIVAAGHSLGEYSAYVAAGALAFEDAVKLVHLRGTFMQQAVPLGTGTMLAVLGREVSEIETICKQVTAGVCEISNVNSPGQIVVAGSVPAIEQFQKLAPEFKMIQLSVSAPFHCSLMKPAADKLSEELAKTKFNPTKFPVISNVHAAPVSTEAIRQSLVDQVCGRVRWVESIEAGIKTYTPGRFVEFGAGNVLTGLVKKINPAIPRATMGRLAEIEAFAG